MKVLAFWGKIWGTPGEIGEVSKCWDPRDDLAQRLCVEEYKLPGQAGLATRTLWATVKQDDDTVGAGVRFFVLKLPFDDFPHSYVGPL